MQAITTYPIPDFSQRVNMPVVQPQGRITSPTVFLAELMRTAVRHAQQRPPQPSGEPLRPVTFIPLSSAAAPAPMATTSKGKRRKKKSSSAAGEDALGALLGRR